MKRFSGRIRASLAVLALAASPVLFVGSTSDVQAQSLSDRLKAKNQTGPIAINLACGKLDKANCNQIIPRLAEAAVPRGLNIKPEESEGSSESAQAVCEGLVDGALGQRDAFDQETRKPNCVGKFATVGKPLYPYYGFFVVRANNENKTFDDFLSSTPNGKSRNVAAGKLGSGGQVTLNIILKNRPDAKRVISVQPFSEETALQRLQDGSLDAYFVMDALGSDLIEKIRTAQDKNGQPVYRFLDTRLGGFYSAAKDWNGKPLYQEVNISTSFFKDVRTISTDAVVIVSNAFREDKAKGGPRAIEILGSATDAAEAAIFSDTKTPRDWKSAQAQ